MTTQPETLGDALPREIQRCQKLLEIYATFPNGSFAYTMISIDVATALKAMAEGDVVAMLRSYETLKGCK